MYVPQTFTSSMFLYLLEILVSLKSIDTKSRISCIHERKCTWNFGGLNCTANNLAISPLTDKVAAIATHNHTLINLANHRYKLIPY